MRLGAIALAVAALLAPAAGLRAQPAEPGGAGPGSFPDDEGPPLGPDAVPLEYELPPIGESERVEVGGGPVLTLGQVLSSVERLHPAIEAGRERIRAAEGERLAAEGGFDLMFRAFGFGAPVGYYDYARADISLEQPTPLWGTTFYAGWKFGRGGDFPPYYGQFETLTGGELRAGVRIPLWQDGPIDSRRGRLRQAQQGVQVAEAAFGGQMLEMRLDATQAYWGWVAAGRRYGIVAGLLDLAEERDDQIAARVRSGAIPAIESLENRRTILARREALISARRSLERAAIALSLFLRSEDGTPRVADASRVPTEVPSPGRLEVEIDQAVAEALERRPEMARFAALVERQEVSIALARNRFAPQIDITLGAAADVGSGNEVQQEVIGPPVLEGTLMIAMPLQFREARGGVARTRAELAALQADARLMRDRITTQVQDALSAVRAAEEQVELARQSAQVATAVAIAERRRFRLGAAQLFIVNLREQAAALARARLVDAEAAVEVARATWRAATAQPVGG
ncbi:MAG: TolC family protein [Sandaracinaceae bacterium]